MKATAFAGGLPSTQGMAQGQEEQGALPHQASQLFFPPAVCLFTLLYPQFIFPVKWAMSFREMWVRNMPVILTPQIRDRIFTKCSESFTWKGTEPQRTHWGDPRLRLPGMETCGVIHLAHFQV